MTKIPLRSYTREIESMIERGVTDEAIAHCRYILKLYPKFIETYRLLGKAFLESQRYSEAADILQRVLSVYPDDFFAQIGMSIIREDEGNLDAAIFHMERAYETQPANNAVQDELRRLYGKRDGAEPPRLRLSRGSLVRMYARGGLDRQAIAEIRAALIEDPQRIDLEVILAKIHHHSGDKIEAVEVASRLLTRLPYCFDANLILAETLPSTAHAQDAQIHMERLLALDPYMAHLSIGAPTIQQVPDDAVMIDRLDWHPVDSGQAQPDWAQTAGVLIDRATEQQPAWLNKPPEASTMNETQSEEMKIEEAVPSIEPVAQTEKDLPDWMRDAGWTVSTGSGEDQPQPIPDEAQIHSEGEAEKSELPDWLKDFAPDKVEIPLAAETEQEETKSDSQIYPEAASVSVENETVGSELPATEETGISSVLEEPIAPVNLPDWLQELPAEVPASESQDLLEPLVFESTGITEPSQGIVTPESETDKPAEVQADLRPIPDWLKGIDLLESQSEQGDQISVEGVESQGEPKIEPSEELIQEVKTTASILPAEPFPLDIRIEGQSEPSTAILESEGAIKESILSPESLQDGLPEVEMGETPISESGKQPSDVFAVDEIPAQLPSEEEIIIQDQGLAKNDEAITIIAELPEMEMVSDELSSEPVVEVETSPVSDIPEGERDIKSVDDVEAQIPGDAAELAVEPGIVDEIAPETIAEVPEVESQPVGDIPVGLPDSEDLQVSVTEGQESAPGSPEDHVGQGTTEAEPQQEAEKLAKIPAFELADEHPAPETSDTSPQPPAEMDFDTAFAWLESLAAQQGAESGTLITSPEDRQFTPPDWVLEPTPEESVSPTQPVRLYPAVSEDKEPEPSIPTISSGEATEEILPEIEADVAENRAEPGIDQPIQDSVDQAEDDGIKPIEVPEILQTSGLRPLPDWLKGMSVEPDQTSSEPADNVELPDWLQEIKDKQTSGEITQEKTGEVLPDWSIEESAIEVPKRPIEVSPPPQEEIPAWLKELEASQIGESEGKLTSEEDLKARKVEETGDEASTAGSLDPTDLLAQAQAAIANGEIEKSIRSYEQLIQNNSLLDEVIHDLRDSLYRFPMEISIWQLLGDAYLHNNQIQEALDAYTKAEDFLH